MTKNARIALDLSGFYVSIIAPCVLVLAMQLVYAKAIPLLRFTLTTEWKFIIRLIVHPLIFEGVLVGIRYLVFKIPFGGETALLLTVPGTLLRAFSS